MLIKEYRIPMPMSVEEYRIAQLYMIAKKSKQESQSGSSGVEILQNEPYTDEDGGSGQYTFKIYRVEEHLPAWMKSVIAKAALTVEEVSWNAYPYTKTRYSCKFLEKFSIEIETIYSDDCGTQENVFNLPPSDIDRPIDVIDFVRETLPQNEGIFEEDLKIYQSQKTRRGPLPDNWLDAYYADKYKGPVMCAYKLCKVEFKYWGVQSKVEKFIHDTALRRTMLTAHQQAWVWQDEWFGLTMDDIRKIEVETQEYLKKKMNSHINGEEPCAVDTEQSAGDTIEPDNDFVRSFKDDKSKIRSDSRSALATDALDVISTLRLKSLVTESDSDSDQTFYDAEDDIQFDDVPVKYIPQADTETDDDISSVMSSRTSNRTYDEETLYGANSECSISTLIIIFHGGALIDSGQESELSEENDVKTFRKSMDFVIGQHYTHLTGKLAIRSVKCHEFCRETRKLLANISPDGLKNNTSIPIGALPICAIVSRDYRTYILDVIAQANNVYKDFINSTEGKGFMGKVCLIADSIGAIVVYDALCQQSGRQCEPYSSQNSIPERFNRSESPVSNKFLNANSGHSSMESLAKSRTLPFTASCTQNSVPIPSPGTPIYLKSMSHPGEGVNKQLLKTDSSLDFGIDGPGFAFEVNDFFMFGSLVGLVLTFRKIMAPHKSLIKPNCQNIYNLFHNAEPSALRLEPLLVNRFSNLEPVFIPRHAEYPLGDGTPVTLNEYLPDENSDDSVQSAMQKWWGKKRIDYQIYSPRGLTSFPTSSLPLIFHASYWESNDVIAFILRQFNRQQTLSRLNSPNYHTNATSALSVRSYSFRPNQAREKWKKKRTTVKIGKLAANHRANDVIVCEGRQKDQTIIGRFMYGPLDLIALNGEAVDIYMKCYKNEEWSYLQTVLTDKTGRVSYTVPRTLSCGLYKFRMLVRGDHTVLDLFMAVVPSQTEAVVFSIDGSLTASFSVLGHDPKVRPGAVDVVRFWQERGYLIIYITGRPDIQQSRIVSWMSQHNFPHGLVYFLDGFTTDPVGHKADYLRSLKDNMKIIFAAGYGSSKDVHMYEALNLPSERIYTVGKVPKKLQSLVHWITDGYATHLRELRSNNGYSPKFQANPRAVLPKGSFSQKRIFSPKNIS